jgi:hypothetical protein
MNRKNCRGRQRYRGMRRMGLAKAGCWTHTEDKIIPPETVCLWRSGALDRAGCQAVKFLSCEVFYGL